ncbi:MAG: zinc-binding dehydrogenase, partial [Candidatus Dormiibacterota bacterium]
VWIWSAAAGRRWGTAAQWTIVPEPQAVRLPDRASLELGASLGVPALTAHRCLFADGDVAGRNVLVAGGAGAVGHFAIEIAKHRGARVATTVSTEAKAELARAAGADLVVNYREPDAREQLRSFAARMDRIVEVNLAANLALDLALAGPETVIAAYAIDGPDPVLPVRACMSANVVLRFVLLYGVPRPALDRAVAEVSAALEAGALSELPIHRFPLDQCAAAHDAVQSGVVGKVVLDISA